MKLVRWANLEQWNAADEKEEEGDQDWTSYSSPLATFQQGRRGHEDSTPQKDLPRNKPRVQPYSFSKRQNDVSISVNNLKMLNCKTSRKQLSVLQTGTSIHTTIPACISTSESPYLSKVVRVSSPLPHTNIAPSTLGCWVSFELKLLLITNSFNGHTDTPHNPTQYIGSLDFRISSYYSIHNSNWERHSPHPYALSSDTVNTS